MTAEQTPRRRRVVRRNGQGIQRTEEEVVSVPLPPAEPQPVAPEQPWSALTEFPAELVSQPPPPRPTAPVPYVMMGDRKITPDQLQAVETLGISKKKWDYAKRLAIEQLGDWLNVPFVGKILMIDGFDGIEQVQYTMQFCREILEHDPQKHPEKKYTVAEKLQAGELMTMCAKALKDFISQGVELAEKTSVKKGGDERPRNRPPMAVNLQINNNPSNGNPQAPMARIGFPDGAPSTQS